MRPITSEKILTQEEQERVDAQRKYDCLIPGCKEKGRRLAEFKGPNLILSYCPRHRPLGEKIIRRLLKDMIDFSNREFIDEGKSKFIEKNELEFCNDCLIKLSNHIKTKTELACEIHDLKKTKDSKFSDEEDEEDEV